MFFVDKDDHLQPVPLKRFERFVLCEDSSERFPEFAGERVRYALITVEVEDRRPVAIKRADYSILKLTSRGKLDRVEWNRALRLVMGMISLPLPKAQNSSVIDASSRFYRKRHEDEFRWQPSQEIEAAIEQAIFSNKNC